MNWLLTFLETAASIPDAPSNSDLSNLLVQITGVVKNIILPTIYVILGLFLIVKGALLGMQIVKAADEPQVRQEKIGSLKWLIIGVAIAFGVTIAADAVLATFRESLGTQTK